MFGLGEEPVDALVGGDVGDEIVDHGGDRVLAAEPVVERLLLHRLMPMSWQAASSSAATSTSGNASLA